MVETVLRKHRIDYQRLESTDADGRPLISWALEYSGQPYLIEAFIDSLAMTSGESLFEPYMSDEFFDERSYIGGFTKRLDQFFSGEGWEGRDE